jgi:hypothetical protein
MNTRLVAQSWNIKVELTELEARAINIQIDEWQKAVMADEHRQAMHRAANRICTAWPRAHADSQAIGYPRGHRYDTTSRGTPSIDVDGENVPATAVEIAALSGNRSVAWLAQFHDVVTNLVRQALGGRVAVWTQLLVPVYLQDAIEALWATGWTLEDIIDADPHSPTYRRDVFGLYDLADKAARWWPDPVKNGQRIGQVTVGQRTNDAAMCVLCGDPVSGTSDDPIRRIDGQPFHGKTCYYQVWRQRRRTS